MNIGLMKESTTRYKSNWFQTARWGMWKGSLHSLSISSRNNKTKALNILEYQTILPSYPKRGVHNHFIYHTQSYIAAM